MGVTLSSNRDRDILLTSLYAFSLFQQEVWAKPQLGMDYTWGNYAKKYKQSRKGLKLVFMHFHAGKDVFVIGQWQIKPQKRMSWRKDPGRAM